MSKQEIVKELYKILEKITDKKCCLQNLDEVSLFAKEWALEPRDVVYFLLFINDKFKIKFDSSKINDFTFFNLNNISQEIEYILNDVKNESLKRIK